MSFAATNNTIWKDIATEKEDAARTMGRISLGLFVACTLLAMTAFSAHSNYSRICSFVDERQQGEATSFSDEEITAVLKAEYCS